MKKKKTTLRLILLKYFGGLLAAAFVLSSIVILFNVYQITYKNIRDQVLPLRNSSLSRHFSNELHEVLIHADGVKRNLLVQEWFERKSNDENILIEQMRNYDDVFQAFDDFGLVDINRYKIISSDHMSDYDPESSGFSWINSLLGMKENFDVSFKYYTESNTTRGRLNEYYMFVDQKIILDDKCEGIFYTAKSLKDFYNKLVELEEGNFSRNYLIDGNKVVIHNVLRYDDGEVLEKEEDFSLIQNLVEERADGIFEYTKGDDKYLASLQTVPGSDLKVMSSVQVKEMVMPFFKSLGQKFLLVQFVIFGLCFLVIFWISRYFKNATYKMIEIAKYLQKGDFEKIDKGFDTSVYELESLKSTYDELADSIEDSTKFAREIEKGNLDVEYERNFADNKLMKSLLEMRSALKNAKLKDQQDQWVVENMATFNEVLRSSEEEVEKLTSYILSKVMELLNASQGAIYLEENGVLKLAASYAYHFNDGSVEEEMLVGEGILGQAYKDKEFVCLSDFPEDYLPIISGLGESKPKAVYISPLLTNENAEGVIEIASFYEFEEHEIAFIKKMSEALASTIAFMKSKEKISKFLEESQLQTETLRIQEEEMRQNMEELLATQEKMTKLQNDSLAKEKALEAWFGVEMSKSSFVVFTVEFNVAFSSMPNFSKTGLRVLEGNVNDNSIIFEEWKSKFAEARKIGREINFKISSERNGIAYQLSPLRGENDIVFGYILKYA
ncbi:GAF domain-containing protein [Aureibacter tunicatorum]|uniref:Methionine-R-sulfoxide reductase with GAF domain n=1 Tax=Aureibacter tunicatorum TaxID=866807 RepID=A0AAE3XK39_9BACT|nr:GAF domain-containing protein [Aureibacter tunicatorum]MDR6238367.1 putative methionine-R-sulfoxide reductase with GAF domain [Aureibacter tunicatorum]BDD03399.1 hypothetical protein AUTU_08820 [Aureibacter tunicatorum]